MYSFDVRSVPTVDTVIYPPFALPYAISQSMISRCKLTVGYTCSLAVFPGREKFALTTEVALGRKNERVEVNVAHFPLLLLSSPGVFEVWR